MAHLTGDDLDAALDHIRRSPADDGRVELIVRRPAEDEREVLDEGQLDRDEGLVGDTWRARAPAKFAARFGQDALRFVNSAVGRELNLRGVNAKVVEGGAVRPGDTVRKLIPRQ